MTALSNHEAMRLYGTIEPQASRRTLKAGQLSCEFEAGGLRHVFWGTTEIARGIVYLFRDSDWGTASSEVLDLAIVETPGQFVLDFKLQITVPDGRLDAMARIEGTSDGRLQFRVSATPDAKVMTNRCGFVVLHPAASAGRPLAVEHTNGVIEHAIFPTQISPSQPVFDIRGLNWSPADGLSLRCRLDAELPGSLAGMYEMEDQRNWTDASFKTYVGSLLEPWPYALEAGVTRVQRVALEVSGSVPDLQHASEATRNLGVGEASGVRMPAIGIGVPAGLHGATAREHEAMRCLGAGWWVLDATLDDPRLADELATLASLRRGLPVRVQLDAIVPAGMTPEQAAHRAAVLCKAAGLSVDAIRLLPAEYLLSYQPSAVWPDLAPLEAFAEAARRTFADAQVGGGMFTYFTELNRKRPPAAGLDFIGHATCPIVHAADDVSVMETIETLHDVVHSVHALWPGLPYRLGPSTIASLRNPYGSAVVPNPQRRRLPLACKDPRHRGQFAAAWTVAYASAVAHAGLDVLALHHGHGASGPFAGGDDIVPAWRVLERLAAAAGDTVVPIEGTGRGLAGVAWKGSNGALDGLLANLTPGRINLLWGTRIAPVSLGPFEVIDLPRAGL